MSADTSKTNDAEKVSIQCSCGKRLDASSVHPGKAFACPACGAAFVVKASDSPPRDRLKKSLPSRSLLPITSSVEVIKNVFGTLRVVYKCPNCKEQLGSRLKEAGASDSCPNCHARFVVPGTDELQREEARQQAQRQRKLEQRKERAERRRQDAADNKIKRKYHLDRPGRDSHDVPDIPTSVWVVGIVVDTAPIVVES